MIAGNHDEALAYDGVRFASTVSPSDFADFLNANLAHEWIERAGKLAVRLFAQRAARALLPRRAAGRAWRLSARRPARASCAETGDWNDPACLTDFVWTRAHPKARKKLPNRFSRGSQFGYEDFAAFCALSAELGTAGHAHGARPRPCRGALRGLSRLSRASGAHDRRPVAPPRRESFGPYERVPTIARCVRGRASPGVPAAHPGRHDPRGLSGSIAPRGRPRTSETIQEPQR